jgi:ATP-dependent Clp endopeptidase proteolytic subunit ClpP
MSVETEMLDVPEIRDALLERIKAETDLHRLHSQIDKIKLGEMERGEAAELARMRHYGEYLFYNPIVEQTVATAMLDLFSWSKREPGKPITVTFNSPGGYVTDGFTLFDFLRDLSNKGTPITTRCIGIAASMGAILMQAGDERVMTPNAFMMIHEVEGKGEGSTTEREEQLEIAKRFQERGLNILAERSTMSKAEIQKRWKKADWYLTADEALDYGFIDRIEGRPSRRRRKKAR